LERCFPSCWHQPLILFNSDVDLLCYYLPLDNIFSLKWGRRHLFTSCSLHSPHFFPSYVVFGVKLSVNSPTLCFPMSIQLAIVEKVHMATTMIASHTPHLHVPLCLLSSWSSLLVIQLMRKIKYGEHGLLLLALCLTMAFLPTKRTWLCIPIVVYGMWSLLAAVPHEKFLV